VTTCPECGTAFDDEAFAQCPTCELSEAPRELATAAAAPDEGLSRQLSALKAGLFGAARAEAPAESRLALKPPEPVEAPAAEDEETSSSGEITFARLAELRRSKRMVIGILGFPTAGKTWFLNRLKHNWVFERGNKASPPPADGGSLVGATQIVTEHTFTRPGGGFHVIDLPGERFEKAAETNFQSDPLVLAVIDACGALAIMLPADEALFSGHAAARFEARKAGGADEGPLSETTAEVERQLAEAEREVARLKRLQKKQPSDELAAELEAALAERDAAKAEAKALKARRLADHGAGLAEAHRRLERFIGGLGHVSGLLSLKARADAPDRPIRPAEVDAHIMSGAFRPFAKPVYVALSKADNILDPEGLAAEFFANRAEYEAWAQVFDQDPLATVHEFKPTLARQFSRWFRWVKFDFLTAFREHRGGLSINYDLDSCGVNAVVDWMDWIARYDQLPAWERAMLAAAVRLRRLRDWRPQSAGLQAVGGGVAAKGPSGGGAMRYPAEASRVLKRGIDLLFAKTRWPIAPLAAGVLALAIAAGAGVALTGAVAGEAPKVKDPEAQAMLGVVTGADPKAAALICSQNQTADARAVRAWAIRLHHDCPGVTGAVAPWPLVVRLGAWLGVPLTALLLGLSIVAPGAMLLGYLALRRAYGDLYASEHSADRLAAGAGG
jgi:hypothetical protein